jgi:hypothetical protein
MEPSSPSLSSVSEGATTIVCSSWVIALIDDHSGTSLRCSSSNWDVLIASPSTLRRGPGVKSRLLWWTSFRPPLGSGSRIAR